MENEISGLSTKLENLRSTRAEWAIQATNWIQENNVDLEDTSIPQVKNFLLTKEKLDNKIASSEEKLESRKNALKKLKIQKSIKIEQEL